MKHLGVWINEDGEVTEEDNIASILEHMEALVKRYATSGSTLYMPSNFWVLGMYIGYRTP